MQHSSPRRGPIFTCIRWVDTLLGHKGERASDRESGAWVTTNADTTCAQHSNTHAVLMFRQMKEELFDEEEVLKVSNGNIFLKANGTKESEYILQYLLASSLL